MKKAINFFIGGSLMILVTWAMFACNPQKTTNSTETDKAAIREWNDKGLTMGKGLNKENAETFVRFMYTEEVIVFPPNAKSIKGIEALIGFYQNYPPMSDFNHEIKEIEVFGEYAYLWLNWSIPVKLPKLDPYVDSGIIFVILRKQSNGNWKIWRELWNSDIPIPVNASTPNP